MGYVILAARQMIDEVQAIDGKAKVTVLPDVDGLGRHRSIRIEGATGKRLGVVLEASNDERIAAVKKSAKGTRVDFVTSSLADWSHSFDLAAGLAVLDED